MTMRITQESFEAFLKCPTKSRLVSEGSNGVESEFHDLLNKANAGIPIGNVFSAGAQSAPALAFVTVAPSPTPARVTGLIPENTLDAFDAVTAGRLFLSQRFMHTSSRRIQAAVKFIF